MADEAPHRAAHKQAPCDIALAGTGTAPLHQSTRPPTLRPATREGPLRTVKNQITAQVLYVVSVLALGGSITLAVSRGW